jgi:hypothetical protein
MHHVREGVHVLYWGNNYIIILGHKCMYYARGKSIYYIRDISSCMALGYKCKYYTRGVSPCIIRGYKCMYSTRLYVHLLC